MEGETSCKREETVANDFQTKAMAPDSTSHTIDINKEPDQYLNWHECCIYRVPINLREVNKEAYTPWLISIGPFHHGTEELEPMQQQKQRYKQYLLERASNGKAFLKGYESYLKKEEQNIRNCYHAESLPHIKEDKFLDMILLDAMFIMELFLRTRWGESDSSRPEEEGRMDPKSFRQKYKNDYILTQPWLSKGIHRDLLLLENQLPFFVLNQLYEDIITPDVDQRPCKRFLDLACKYFASKDTNYQQAWNQDHEPIHFTDLVRSFYLPKYLVKWEDSRGLHRPATLLRQQSGVSFEKVQGRSLLEIRFYKDPVLGWFLCFGCLPCSASVKARLQIPQLKLDHNTEYVLRNLIAFEQCHYPLQPYICSYVSLIDSLIHSKDDVELLVEKEIIEHELGSEEEVATLINGLCKHVVANSTCYAEVIDELRKHHGSCWNRTMTPLRLVYFRNLWLAISTVVAVGLLLLTLIKIYEHFLL